MAFGSNRKNREIVLQGRNIFKDKHNRYVYYKRSKKTGYVITPDKISQFQMMSMRYVLGICVTALTYSFNISLLVAGGVGLGIILVLEFMFRFKMLPSLTQIPNFDPTGKPGQIENLATNLSSARLYLLAVLYIVFAILFIMLGFENDYGDIYWALVAIVCLGSIYFSYIHIKAARYQVTHKIEVKEKTVKLKIKK